MYINIADSQNQDGSWTEAAGIDPQPNTDIAYEGPFSETEARAKVEEMAQEAEKAGAEVERHDGGFYATYSA